MTVKASLIVYGEKLRLAVHLDADAGFIFLLYNAGVDESVHQYGRTLVVLGSLLRDFQLSFDLIKPGHLSPDFIFAFELFLLLLFNLGLSAAALCPELHHMYTRAVLL